MGRLRVGIIGLGVGSKYIPWIIGNDLFELSAVCDFNESKIQEFILTYPHIPTTLNSSELINSFDLDVVLIASYDDYHFEQVIECVESGKHVFVEKPLALFKHQAEAIKEALTKNPHIKLSSNLPLRSCPRFINLKKEISTGAMGNVYHLEADYLWGRTEKLVQGWRKDMEYYSIIHGASVHMVDLVLWLTGKKVRAVYGLGNNLVTENYDFKYNDFAATLLKFEDGSSAKICSHGGCVHPHFHSLKVFGSKKTFVQDLISSYWVDSCNPDEEILKDTFEYPAKASRGNILESFLLFCLDDKCEPLVTADDVFKSMSICYAAQKATDENTLIEVNYI
jgi:predicted dehydrogenase